MKHPVLTALTLLTLPASGATQPFSGTYAVAPDCGIQMAVIPPPPLDFPVPFAGAVSDNRRRISAMIVGPGAVVSGEFERMSINGSTNRTLEGGFSMTLDGTVLTPASAAGPYKASGRVVFDGAGGVRASGASTTTATSLRCYSPTAMRSRTSVRFRSTTRSAR